LNEREYLRDLSIDDRIILLWTVRMVNEFISLSTESNGGLLLTL
jgi:hypothetical protein